MKGWQVKTWRIQLVQTAPGQMCSLKPLRLTFRIDFREQCESVALTAQPAPDCQLSTSWLQDGSSQSGAAKLHTSEPGPTNSLTWVIFPLRIAMDFCFNDLRGNERLKEKPLWFLSMKITETSLHSKFFLIVTPRLGQVHYSVENSLCRYWELLKTGKKIFCLGNWALSKCMANSQSLCCVAGKGSSKYRVAQHMADHQREGFLKVCLRQIYYSDLQGINWFHFYCFPSTNHLQATPFNNLL